MSYLAIIEIPKGSDRRTHMSYDKSGFIDLGPIKEYIPVNNGVMPVHYGYLDGTFNKDDDDEVDVMVFSKRAYKTGDKVQVEIIGMITREDGDTKVIAHDDSETPPVFSDLIEAERKIILDFMGYKSPITGIKTKQEALDYIKDSIILL